MAEKSASPSLCCRADVERRVTAFVLNKPGVQIGFIIIIIIIINLNFNAFMFLRIFCIILLVFHKCLERKKRFTLTMDSNVRDFDVRDIFIDPN